MDFQQREALIKFALKMNASGINQGTSGNLSVRSKAGFLITPSALPYDQCLAQDMVPMSLDGKAGGVRKPSSEWRFHRDIYVQRTEARAVLHAHSPWATTLACLKKPIPAFHYMVAVAGGVDIRCAPYAMFGTEKLSRYTLEALQDRKACLLANHGMVCLGDSLEQVFSLAIEVESLARVYVQALQVGEPEYLPESEMRRVLHAFTTYRPE
ncbi:MAG TPA: class II aldolase [Gammaproteobacteria bacterium]|nr:class II aldolase [Gammaproteobacteria bacterium]